MTPNRLVCRRLTVGVGLIVALAACCAGRSARATQSNAPTPQSRGATGSLRAAPSVRDLIPGAGVADVPSEVYPSDEEALPLPSNVRQPVASGERFPYSNVRLAANEEEIYYDPSSVPSEVYFDEHHAGHAMSCDGWGCAAIACRCRFVRLEGLGMWGPGSNLPVLVSNDVLPAIPLFGGDRIESEGRGGGRLTIGKWLDAAQTVAIMGRLYAVDDETLNFQLESEGALPIARPFFSLENSNGQVVGPDALFVAGQGVAGQIGVTGRNRVAGIDVLLRRMVYAGPGTSVDFLIGYNAARIDEDLTIASTSRLNNIEIAVSDAYDATNEYHAATFGFLARRDRGRWGLEMLGKISLGEMSQAITMDGSATNSNFGLFIQDHNEGTFGNSALVISPEVGVNLICRVRPNLDLTFGYSFMYWSSVARPESFLPYDLAVNPNSPSAPSEIPNPEFRFMHDDFWLQGITAGIGFSF